jgi:hypothetical protein
VITTVHVADIGAAQALRTLLRPPRPHDTPGLRHADVGLAAPLSGNTRPSPSLGRVVLVGFWDDSASVDRFEATHPVAARLADGWRVRARPLRRFGTWPGMPDDIPTKRQTEYTGPSLVLTLGRVRVPRVRDFLRTSAAAEAAVCQAPGVVWATGFARPPFVATCSLWESTAALSAYAYGDRDAGHPQAITADRAQPFHKRSAFVRFEPLSVAGTIGGKNAMSRPWPAVAASS